MVERREKDGSSGKTQAGDGAKKRFLRIQNVSHESETLPPSPLPPSSAVPPCPGLSKGVVEERMAQFQEMMRQQLESSMQTELEKLLDTSTGSEKEVRQHAPPLSPCCSHTIWLWFGVCLRHSITEWKQHRPYTFGGSPPPRVPPFWRASRECSE